MRGRRGRYDGVHCGAAAEGKRGAAAADLHFCEGILRDLQYLYTIHYYLLLSKNRRVGFSEE